MADERTFFFEGPSKQYVRIFYSPSLHDTGKHSFSCIISEEYRQELAMLIIVLHIIVR